jgi:putative ABC transport system substrate-binding protein
MRQFSMFNFRFCIEPSRRKNVFSVALGVLLLPFGFSAQAQQPAKIVPHIGFQLDAPTASTATRIEAFRQGLRDLGYLEGKNIIIEWRSSEGKLERRSEIAAELVRLKVDVIVSAGPTVTRVLKEVTSTIPIVMAQDPDALGSGFVAAWRAPGKTLRVWQVFRPRIAENNWSF